MQGGLGHYRKEISIIPETRTNVTQATDCSEEDGNTMSLGWSTRRDDDFTFPKKSHCCHFTEAKAASAGGGGRTRWRGKTLGRNSGDCKESAEEPAGPPRSDGGNAAINKSAGACGGLWLLTCAANTLVSLWRHTWNPSQFRSQRRPVRKVRKANHLFCLELHVRLPLKHFPWAPGGWGWGGGLWLTFKHSCFASTVCSDRRPAESAPQRCSNMQPCWLKVQQKSIHAAQTGTMGVCTRGTWSQEEVQKGQAVKMKVWAEFEVYRQASSRNLDLHLLFVTLGSADGVFRRKNRCGDTCSEHLEHSSQRH